MKTIGVFGSNAEQIAAMLNAWQLPCTVENPATIATVESLPEVLVLRAESAVAAVAAVESFRRLGYGGKVVVLSEELLLERETAHLLMIGADYALTSTASPELFQATIFAAARVYEAALAKVYSVGDLIINTETQRALVKGKVLPLRPTPYNLLVLLVRYRHKALSRVEILQQLRPTKHRNIQDRLVDVLVSRIRKALSDAGCMNVSVRTVPRHGYQLEVN